MGCKTSKVDRLPAVALCRDRCKFIDEALRQSYALADAHVAHMVCLKTLGPALLYFFQQFEQHSHSPINQTKSPPPRPLSPSPYSSSSDSDAHVLLHSESEAKEDANKESLLFTQSRYDYLNHDTAASPPDNVAFMNYVQPLYAPFSPPRGYSKPPSPPSPPSGSAWDFLNFFEPYDKCEVVSYIPSHGDRHGEEIEEKGRVISDVPQKGVGESESNGGGGGAGKVNEEKYEEADSRGRNLDSEKEPTESEICSNSVKVKSAKGLREAVREIQILFERASDSGNPILEMLDVGKLRYHPKFALNPGSSVSCKMMHVFTPSIPSKPLAVKCMGSSEFQGDDKDKGHSCVNLPSTLKKLYMWEKKLYHEVKAEEKLRQLHQKKCRQLRRMNKKGADAHKVESVQTFVGILATKMKISIHVVDKVSDKICKLREEELWPQIKRIIHMFIGMWKDMQECYRCQYQEIAEAKTLDASTFNRKLSNAEIDAVIKLKSEVQNWNSSFSDWIQAQKSHVKALNGWLVRCLLYEPEEIPGDSTPFSPSKIGAPPVFVICNKWSQVMDTLSEKNVMEEVNGFMLRVNEILEKHISDLQQKLTLDKELERKVKILERQEQKTHKVVQAREGKMVPIAREGSDALLQGDAVHHGDFVDTDNIQSGLKQIFVAMERFTATTARLYEELCQQIKPDNHVL